MMKKMLVFVLFFILIISAIFVNAKEEEKDEKVPPGMERIQIENNYYIIPEGAQVIKKGNVVTFEHIDEYSARRLYEMNKRIVALESSVEELKKDVAGLKAKEASSQIEK